MNRKTLIDAVHETHQDLSKKRVSELVDSVLSTIRNSLANGETLALQNFITISPITRKARNGVNPKTLARVLIPAKKSLRIKVGAGLKKALNS